MKTNSFNKLGFMKETIETETFNRMRFKVNQINTIRQWANDLGYEFSINSALTNIRLHVEHIVEDTKKVHRVFNVQNIKGKCFVGFYNERKEFVIVQNITSNLLTFKLMKAFNKFLSINDRVFTDESFDLPERSLIYGLPQMQLAY